MRDLDPPESQDVEEARQMLHAFYEAAASYQGKVLEASSGYNQIVVLGGYAGFFAIWSTMAADLPRWVTQLSGGLIGVSLIVYVGWTVLGMIMIRNHHQLVLNEISKGPQDYLARVTAAEAKGVADSNTYMRFWKPVLWAAGLPALFGAALLVGAAFQQVAGSL